MSPDVQAAFEKCMISVNKAPLKAGSTHEVDQGGLETELKKFALLFKAEHKVISINNLV